MNPDLVYARTAEGERLARSPRQIASYGQRATLLLVDGEISVGELQRRFGETLPVEEMLAQLEQDGLVHIKETQGASEAVAETPGTEAKPEPAREPEPAPRVEPESRSKPKSRSKSNSKLKSKAKPKAEPEPRPEPEAEPEVEESVTLHLDPLFDPAVERWHGEASKAQETRREPTLVRAGEAWTAAEEVPEHPSAPGVGQGDEAEGFEMPAPPADEGPSPPKRTRLADKAWWIGSAAVVLCVVVGVSLWLARLRPQVEARASEALGVPVAVGSVGPAFQNGPALVLKDVTVGRDLPVVLPRVAIMPDPSRGNVWSPSRVVVIDASLKPSELNTLARLTGGNRAVTAVEFSDLGLQLGARRVGALAGNMESSPEGGVVFKLADPAGGLTLELRPSGRGLTANLTAAPGRLALLGHPQIGTVELKGQLDDIGLPAGELGMTAYGGKFDGLLAVNWAGPVSLEAKLQMAAVSMNQLSRSLFKSGGFSEGQASGTLTAEAKAAHWDDLTQIDRLTASFMVERGAFKGFDLGAALRERSPRPTSGGETRFESLRGRLAAGPKEIRLWVDRMDSGALTASGSLTVAGFDSLRGNLAAAVQAAGRGTQRFPTQLGGTVAVPTIQLILPTSGERMPVQGGGDREEEQQ